MILANGTRNGRIITILLWRPSLEASTYLKRHYRPYLESNLEYVDIDRHNDLYDLNTSQLIKNGCMLVPERENAR